MKFEFDERNEIRLCGVVICYIWQGVYLRDCTRSDALGPTEYPDLASAQAAGIAIAEAWWARVLAEKDKQDSGCTNGGGRG